MRYGGPTQCAGNWVLTHLRSMAYVFEVTNFLLGFDQCFLFIADLFIKNYSRMYKCHHFTFQSLDFELKIAIISFKILRGTLFAFKMFFAGVSFPGGYTPTTSSSPVRLPLAINILVVDAIIVGESSSSNHSAGS